MFKTNFKIAWRNLVKDRLFSLLNLTGLGTGLAAVLFIFLWVSDERDMDRFHANDSRLYQVLGSIRLADGIFTQNSTPGPLAKSLVKDMPEVELATTVIQAGVSGIVSYGDKHIKAVYRVCGQQFFQRIQLSADSRKYRHYIFQ